MNKIDLDSKKLCFLYNNGIDAVKLSRMFNVSYGTIYNHRKKNNVIIRTNGESHKGQKA
jgi:phosphoribosylaminoimidazole-succinocarboxamide synthase